MSNTRELNNNDDIYIGIRFPLNHNESGFFYKTKTLNEQVKSNIRNVLLTSKGERVFQPNFGSDLQRLLFEPYTDSFIDDIQNTITESLNTFLPYVNINNIFVVQNESNPNMVNVQIEYSTTIEPNSLDSITFNFNVDSEGT